MKKLLVLMVGLILIAGPAAAKNAQQHQLFMVEDGQGLFNDISNAGMFGVAQAGTTWIGYTPTGSGPWDVGSPGYWDFDDRGTHACPTEDGDQEYIKNGAYAQGWTSEDVLEQKGLYWHAETYSGALLACSSNPITGNVSAWCGRYSVNPGECFNDAPGYGHNWSQWLCKSVTMDPVAPTLTYTFNSDTEPGFDYCYVIIDGQYPDSCGYVDENSDSLACYDGYNGTTTKTWDLSNWTADPDLCDDPAFHYDPDYTGDSVKVCFVVVSDGAWDDADGSYPTCDGAMNVDDILINVAASSGDTVFTTFEDTTLSGWTACGGFHAGDYAAIRNVNSFINNAACEFQNCDMDGCVLAFWDPDISGQYFNGGHYAGDCFIRAWSPTIDTHSLPTRGYMIRSDRYVDLPITNWIFYRYYVRYWQDVDCPTGAISGAVSDNYVYYASPASCDQRTWAFSQYVPVDADSIQIGLSVYNGCNAWEVACGEGNESPIFDNVKMGWFDLSAPMASIRAVDNYTDAFPENQSLNGDETDVALIDAANNKSQQGYFLRLADSAVVQLDAPDVQAELCFRIIPGKYTDLTDAFFTSDYPDAGGWAACEMSDDVFCTRMDTAFAAGDGDTASSYEFQVTFQGYFATMIHEADANWPGYEGKEIFPDSLFTPGTQIYYAFKTKFEGEPEESWLPNVADLAGDPQGTCFEVSVLPDLCKDPLACLLYVDYFNRGAQVPIEAALQLLGRSWDRFDLRAESSHQGNGIGNRKLGPGRYWEMNPPHSSQSRGPIGPSLAHLTQYTAMLVNSGNFEAGTCFSDGGTGTPDDPTNDVTFMKDWIQEGRYKGLWLSGNNIATDFATATSGPKPGFLNHELATDLVSSNYQEWSGHPIADNCRVLKARDGEMRIVNKYSVRDSLRVFGSGCPDNYAYDVLLERDGETGNEFVSLMYDLSDGYASVDHIFQAPISPFDTVRTKIDGFSLHNLRNLSPPCNNVDNIGIAVWIRDVLGGVNNDGYFYGYETSAGTEVQYCPPTGTEDPLIDVPHGGRTYANALFQNYPNPFRGGAMTTIHYSVAKSGPVEIRIFDVAGRLVNTIVDQAKLGDNFVRWDGKSNHGRSVPSGVYFYQIKTDAFSAHKKMLLVN
jgi:hypothetical protein